MIENIICYYHPSCLSIFGVKPDLLWVFDSINIQNIFKVKTLQVTRIRTVKKWRHSMMTSSNGNIYRVTDPLCPSQKPVPRSFDVFLICAWINGWGNNRKAGDLRHTPSDSLWRHCNALTRCSVKCWRYASIHIPFSNTICNYSSIH